MFYEDYEPPHLHAEYQGQHEKFGFDGEPIVGEIPSRTALLLIGEWETLHERELEVD